MTFEREKLMITVFLVYSKSELTKFDITPSYRIYVLLKDNLVPWLNYMKLTGYVENILGTQKILDSELQAKR
jgi:hypothetical protein